MSVGTEKRRKDLVARVVNTFNAGVVPWQRKELPEMPLQSAASGRNYSGLNAMYLMEQCAEKGYTDPRYITASEANKNGLHVRKGEHGVVLEHWKQGDDGKVKPRGYVVFNAAQLSGQLPKPAPEKSVNFEKAAQMLENAGVKIPPGSDAKAYRDEIKKLTVKTAEEMGMTRTVNTPELLALRYSIASTIAMREAGIPVEQTEGAPLKSWAKSIKNDPSQLSKAARDGSVIAGAVVKKMTRGHAEEMFRAGEERAQAQRGQEIVSEAATVPRGLDSNLLNADLSGVQETVIAAADKARTQVNDLRASASSRESSVGADKMAEARSVAQGQMGKKAFVTKAETGKTYSGKIVGIMGSGPDKSALMAISDNHAVLHDIKDLSAKSNLKIGDNMTLSVNENGQSMTQSRDAKSQKNERSREGLKR